MQVAQAADLQDIQKQKEQNQAEVDLDPVSSSAAFTPCMDKSCLVSELHFHPLLNRATGIQGWKQSGEVRGGAGGMLHCSKQLLSSVAGHEEPRSEQREGFLKRPSGMVREHNPTHGGCSGFPSCKITYNSPALQHCLFQTRSESVV